MSGKGKESRDKVGGGGGAAQAGDDREHKPQAVILCDAFGDDAHWAPLVRRKQTDSEEFDNVAVGGEQEPWCLLPLLNAPLLAWTLECLISEGIEQCWLFVKDGTDQVRAWLESSPYNSNPLVTINVRATKADTPGDVLREVDDLSVLSPTDFLVVQAGYVGNVALLQKLNEFTERRKKDPNLCLSCVVTPRVTPTTYKNSLHVLRHDHQLLHYVESPKYPRARQAVLPRELLVGGTECHARADLEAVGVVICSAEVPALFKENFDYQFFYPDFVNGILTSDLLGKTICCSVVGDRAAKGIVLPTEWAAVVGNTKSYDSVSKALLARRGYPLAPDENMPQPRRRYEQRKRKVYYGQNCDVARNSSVASTSLLGQNLVVGPDTTITHSVIGPDVSIGSSCTVSGSYIFERAQVGSNCRVVDSIIGKGVTLADDCVVEGGSLIAGGVKLGVGARLHSSRVTTEASQDESLSSSKDLGSGAVGYLLNSADDGLASSDDEDDQLDHRNVSITRLGHRLDSLHLSSSSSSLSSMSRASSSTSLNSLAVSDTPQLSGLSNLAPASTTNDFEAECKASLVRSLEEDHTVTNAAIELKTLRMASNVTLDRVRAVAIPFLLDQAKDDKAVTTLLERWGGIIRELNGGDKTDVPGMVNSLLIAQAYAAGMQDEEPRVKKYFLNVLRAFYSEDVVDDEAVFAWYQDPAARTTGGSSGKMLYAAARPFVDAVAQSDGSDESDESSD